MKRIVGIAATLAALGLILLPEAVGAAPEQCPEGSVSLQLQPLAAFVDGGELTRGANGRFTNHAGFEFDVEYVTLEPAAGGAVEGCIQPSTKLRATVIDPFTGDSHSFEMEVAP